MLFRGSLIYNISYMNKLFTPLCNLVLKESKNQSDHLYTELFTENMNVNFVTHKKFIFNLNIKIHYIYYNKYKKTL